MRTSHSNDGHTSYFAKCPASSPLTAEVLQLTANIRSIYLPHILHLAMPHTLHSAPHLPLSYLANRRIHRLPNYNASILRIFMPVFHNVSVNAIFCAITMHHSGPGKHPEWRGHASHNTPHPHSARLSWGY